MAITARTIFTSQIVGIWTFVSAFAVVALGIGVYNFFFYEDYTCVLYPMPDPCQEFDISPDDPDRLGWEEAHWIDYVSCYAGADNSQYVVSYARWGLEQHPHSETLYTIKGYHQIRLGLHEDAVDSLSRGVENIPEPTWGILSNNLAWAGLFVPQKMSFFEARGHYERALELEPTYCSIIHTGLWTEFAISRNSSTEERAEALERLDALFQRYIPCVDSLIDLGHPPTVLEAVGLLVMLEQLKSTGWLSPIREQRLRTVRNRLHGNYSNEAAEQICRDAVPLQELHHRCLELLEDRIDYDCHLPYTR